MIQPLEISYLAGLIDADGSIQVMRRKRDEGTGMYSVRLSLTQVTEQIPQWILARFGGRIDKYIASKECRQPLFRWSCESKKAMEIIQLLLPFLVLKQERAKVALKLQETIYFREVGYRLTPELISVREELYQQMKKLNAKHGRNHWVTKTQGEI